MSTDVADVRPIRVTGELLADLGGGASAPETIRFLRSAQLAKHLHLLVALTRAADDDRRATAGAALTVLSTAHRTCPAEVGDLLSEPFVGSWLSSTARRRATDLTALDRLAALAVAAGVRAGTTGELFVPASHGRVHLPGLGTVRDTPDAGLPIRFTDGHLDLGGRTIDPVRRITLGGAAVALEDGDPYRGCYHRPPADRLTDAEFARWTAVLTEAWQMLTEQAPDYADELAAGLRALVPLTVPPDSPEVSATSAIAFGAVALSFPHRPDHAAAALVHEFQHSKLSALLDLVKLHSGDPERRYFAPWRRDARPVGGMLQGAFAFLAVGDLWRRFGIDLETLDASQRNFADLYVQLDEVLTTLSAAPAFTEPGRRLVGDLRTRFDLLMGGAVPASERAAARDRLERHRRRWREFNRL